MKKIIILCAVALLASAAVFTAVKVNRSSEDLFIVENVEALAQYNESVSFGACRTYLYLDFPVCYAQCACGKR